MATYHQEKLLIPLSRHWYNSATTCRSWADFLYKMIHFEIENKALFKPQFFLYVRRMSLESSWCIC